RRHQLQRLPLRLPRPHLRRRRFPVSKSCVSKPAKPAPRASDRRMKLHRSVFLFLVAMFALAAPAFAERTLAKVEVFPNSVALLHARDRQSVVVQATYSDGVTRDIT